MSYERPGRVVDLTANVLLTHGVPHYQGGLTGIPIKQDNPKSLEPLAERTQIKVGVKYVLRVKGVAEIDALAGASVGQAVYINTTTRAMTLTAGAGVVPFGRVQSLAGQFGTPSGKMRVNMDLKDSVPVPS